MMMKCEVRISPAVMMEFVAAIEAVPAKAQSSTTRIRFCRSRRADGPEFRPALEDSSASLCTVKPGRKYQAYSELGMPTATNIVPGKMFSVFVIFPYCDLRF